MPYVLDSLWKVKVSFRIRLKSQLHRRFEVTHVQTQILSDFSDDFRWLNWFNLKVWFIAPTFFFKLRFFQHTWSRPRWSTERETSLVPVSITQDKIMQIILDNIFMKVRSLPHTFVDYFFHTVACVHLQFLSIASFSTPAQIQSRDTIRRLIKKQTKNKWVTWQVNIQQMERETENERQCAGSVFFLIV